MKPKRDPFNKLRQEIFRLHKEEAFRQAIELLQRDGNDFADQEARILFWKVCFYNLIGETVRALQTLAHAIACGYWYGDSWLRADPDLKTLQGHPEFERLVMLSKQLARELAPEVSPMRLDKLPSADIVSPYPLLIALHANNSSAHLSAEDWHEAVRHGWYLSLPMSTQATASDTASWNDDNWAIRDVQHHYHEIVEQQSIDTKQIVIGGFSMGGRQAIMLGLTRAIPVRGILAIGPSLGDDVDRWLPYLEAAKKRKIRVCLIVGDKDNPQFIYDPTIRLSKLLTHQEIPCQLKVYPDMGHVFPNDFADRLPEILAWLVN